MTRLAWLLAALLTAGCAPRPSLESGDPVQRARAIKRLAGTKDPSLALRLVDRLEDDDPAVRFYAVLALRRLTGRDFGYNYALDPQRQPAAVRRWRDFIERQAEEPGQGSGPRPGAPRPAAATAEVQDSGGS